VPAKAFKPAPKVKSCLVAVIPNSKSQIPNSRKPLDWDRFINFLDLFAPFSRKTLGSIEKIVEKHQMERNCTTSLKIDKSRTM